MATGILRQRDHKFPLWVFGVLFCVSSIVLAFNGRPPGKRSFAHMVFGIDDRQLFPLKDKPWLGIGRVEIEISDGVWSNCTGSLVARDLVLTSAHCLIVKGKERGSNVWFRAGVQGASKWSEARIVEKWVGTEWPDENRADDWAVLRLDQPLGDTTGWLQLSPELIGEQKSVTLIGYGDDFLGGHQVAVQSNCMLHNLNRVSGYFMHDCDMNSGTSGAPMINFRGTTPHIVALNVAHTAHVPIYRTPQFTSRHGNVAISLARCAVLVKTILGVK